MKINEAEGLVGIPRKTIRYYEQEGLLTPQRNRANGYRDYGEAELDALRKIKLLRKLGLPLSEIRLVQSGDLTLSDALQRHAIALNRERKRLEQSLAMTEALHAQGVTLEALDAQAQLAQMEQLEQEGTTFMNRQTQDKAPAYWGAILSAIAIALLMAAMVAFLIWGYLTDPIPLPLIVLFLLIPVAIIVGLVLALRQRLNELKGDEYDAARNY
jgi:DNA-binding transcriptional MerR regulator